MVSPKFRTHFSIPRASWVHKTQTQHRGGHPEMDRCCRSTPFFANQSNTFRMLFTLI
jgi:hypothetical protein